MIKAVFSAHKRLKALKILLSTFFIIALLLAIFRNSLLQKVVIHQTQKLKNQYQLQIQYHNIHLSLSGKIAIDSLTVNQANQQLLSMQYLQVSPAWFSFLLGKPKLNKLKVNNFNAYLHLIKNLKAKNDKVPQTIDSSQSADPTDKLRRLLKKYKRLLPGELIAQNIQLHYQDSLNNYILSIIKGQIHHDSGTAQVRLTANHLHQDMEINGKLNPGITFNIRPMQKAALPLLIPSFNAILQFERISAHITLPNTSDDITTIALKGQIEHLRIKHEKLSGDTLKFNTLGGNLSIQIGQGFVALDSQSSFQLNHIKGFVGLQFPTTKKNKIYQLNFQIPETNANTFFASLPEGAFDDTRNLKANGSISYRLSLYLDGNFPDSVRFSSKIQPNNFNIQGYGQTALTLMNQEFSFQAYSYGQPTRRFPVGPSNPVFTPIEQVPPHLIQAILTAEDPAFFYHGGFIPEAIRESIATNYKAGAFKRGGSTISMQLVKNVFLNRKKTIFRKAEEALLVWLIESQRLTSKNRMMEVYLNVIEWGPNVYGIGEASRFYFDKTPAQLSLAEALFLANIIPRPVKYRYAFEPEGTLRSYMISQNKLILNRMILRELIAPVDSTFDFQIKLKGMAGQQFVPIDSLEAPSLTDEEDLF